MPHLTYNPGDRSVPGFAATDIDVTEEEAAYLAGATHSDGSPIYLGTGAVGAIVDEGPEARLALRNRNAARIAEAQAADAAYAAAHANDGQDQTNQSAAEPQPADQAPHAEEPQQPQPEQPAPAEQAPAEQPQAETAPPVENVNVSAQDGAEAHTSQG